MQGSGRKESREVDGWEWDKYKKKSTKIEQDAGRQKVGKKRGEKDDARVGQKEGKEAGGVGGLHLSLSKEDNEASGADLTRCGKSQRAPGAWEVSHRTTTHSLTQI